MHPPRLFRGAALGVAILMLLPPSILAAGPAPPATVAEAIARLDRTDPALWTRSGAPRVAAIEAVLGRDVTAAARDRAWAAHQACGPDRARIGDLETAVATAERLAAEARAETAETRARARAERARAGEGAAEWRARARAAERAHREASARVEEMGRRAELAARRAYDLAHGRAPCLPERAAVAAEIGVWLDDLDQAATRLLRCLAVGETPPPAAPHP